MAPRRLWHAHEHAAWTTEIRGKVLNSLMANISESIDAVPVASIKAS